MPTMGLLTFSLNLTLDGCVDHQEGIANDETHAFFTRLMDEAGAMLWGRVTYEMMEGYWPAVARGDVAAPPAIREWAVKLEAKPKYVVSSTREDFPWTHSHHITQTNPAKTNHCSVYAAFCRGKGTSAVCTVSGTGAGAGTDAGSWRASTRTSESTGVPHARSISSRETATRRPSGWRACSA